MSIAIFCFVWGLVGWIGFFCERRHFRDALLRSQRITSDNFELEMKCAQQENALKEHAKKAELMRVQLEGFRLLKKTDPSDQSNSG